MRDGVTLQDCILVFEGAGRRAFARSFDVEGRLEAVEQVSHDVALVVGGLAVTRALLSGV